MLFVASVVRLHGLPKSIVLKSARCLALSKLLSTSFHPQTDGQTEPSNRTVEDMLRHHTDSIQTDWDQHLPAVEFAINNLIDSVTVVPSSTRLVNDLQESINAAKLCLQQAQQRQKASADMHRCEVTYAVGDIVLLNTKNINI